MSRIGILADVHANLPALEAALEALQEQHVEGLIVAGDMVNLGPQPCETLALLRALDPWVIRGNHEDYIRDLDNGTALGQTRQGPPWAVLHWTHDQLGIEERAYLAALPAQRIVHLPDTTPIRVVHGSPRRTNELLVPPDETLAAEMMDGFRRIGLIDPEAEVALFDEALDGMAEPTLVCGHTHHAWIFRRAGLLALNPGTVGCPGNGRPRVQYGLLTWDGAAWQAELCNIPYDHSRLARAFEESGILSTGAVAQAWRANLLEGRCLILHLREHVRRVARAWGWSDDDALPAPLWEQAAASFNWGAERP